MNYKLIDRILALGNLISQARLAYIEADANLQVSSWNQGARDLFGYTEDDTMGCFLNELIPIRKNKLINCKQTQFLTCSQVNQNGQEVQCDIFYAPIMNTKGEKLGVAVLAKDISARLKDKANLKQQEQYLQDTFGFAPIGIYHVNMEGNIILANPEYAWMLGYESAKAVAEQISDFAVQTFFDKEKADEFMFGVYEAEEVVRFRCRLKRKDNSFVWALCYAKATHDESGRMDGFNGFSIDISETVRAEQALKKLNEKFKMLSVMDGLTQIPNRRRFDEYLESEWKRHSRDKVQLSVILSDIDFFKLYNDNYGHQAGDDCLQKVARAIQDSAHRSSDLAARYGGEEFVLVLPSTDKDGAMAVAEKVRKNVMNLEIAHEKSKVNGHITLSLGVATMVPGNDNSAQDLVALADQALYEAKDNGRNQSISKSIH
ncbi:MAG: diguanylate cyclase [Desulfobacula sp.]|uniref:diguanylate cyclase domain-containing protein n=1 Tax=Desulfobacula sp. TaxID=2593537 RepID=UPI0025BF187A|nr:diguanylate cyclase [Desulfobacula sp.]MCD4722308.1 diguanylate cyclase [Desulfobacula sp.]